VQRSYSFSLPTPLLDATAYSHPSNFSKAKQLACDGRCHGGHLPTASS
jgi:hypothetical protein